MIDGIPVTGPSIFTKRTLLIPNRGTSKSSILIRFSIINHPFGGTPCMETPISSLTHWILITNAPWQGQRVLSLTGRRGRGKSTVAGLGVVAALQQQRSVVVTGPGCNRSWDSRGDYAYEWDTNSWEIHF